MSSPSPSRSPSAEPAVVTPGLKNRFGRCADRHAGRLVDHGLGAKDAGLAIGIAHAAEVELPSAAVVRSLYEKAADSGLDQADIAAVTKLYQAG
jgi:3-hydroxyisobutyrate dehydrogenase